MTIAESFSRALAARGWRYNLDAEDFFGVSGRRLEWEDLIALVPGMALTDLADWEASHRDERMQRAMK